MSVPEGAYPTVALTISSSSFFLFPISPATMKPSLHAAVLLLALLCPSTLTTIYGRKIVDYLPGFDGPLPFYLETGYIEVDEEQGVNLFYYFIKSEKIPEEDPLLYWIVGGPGCSSINGLALEIGPIRFDSESYETGRIPRLNYSLDSWTRDASIVFVDWPADTGYSFARGDAMDGWSDTKSSEFLYVFLRKWLLEHPEFLANPLFAAGDSYGGLLVPIVAQKIINANEAGVTPALNLKGFLAGNPITSDARYDHDTRVDFAHGMGLISHELYEEIKKNCGDNLDVAAELTCKKCLALMAENVAGLHEDNILDPECDIVFPKPSWVHDNERYFFELETNPLYSPLKEKRCREYVYLLTKVWSNIVEVQEALGVSKEWPGNWLLCNRYLKVNYHYEIPSSIPYFFNLTSKGLKGLVYNGDHDMTANFIGTQAWIKNFNFSITSEWRSWRVDSQVVGYTRSYAPHLTYATVKAAGHMAPMYKPKECKAMFERWISGKAL